MSVAQAFNDSGVTCLPALIRFAMIVQAFLACCTIRNANDSSTVNSRLLPPNRCLLCRAFSMASTAADFPLLSVDDSAAGHMFTLPILEVYCRSEIPTAQPESSIDFRACQQQFSTRAAESCVVPHHDRGPIYVGF